MDLSNDLEKTQYWAVIVMLMKEETSDLNDSNSLDKIVVSLNRLQCQLFQSGYSLANNLTSTNCITIPNWCTNGDDFHTKERNCMVLKYLINPFSRKLSKKYSAIKKNISILAGIRKRKYKSRNKN